MKDLPLWFKIVITLLWVFAIAMVSYAITKDLTS